MSIGESLGQPDQVLGGLIALASIHVSRGEPLFGRGLTKRYLTLLGSTNEAPVLAEAHCTAGFVAHCCGNFREAVSHFHKAEHYASGDVSFFGGALFKTMIASNGSLPLQLLGWPDQALKSAEQGLRDARESRNLFSLGLAMTARLMFFLDATPLTSGSTFRGDQGEAETILRYSEQAIALSEENGFSEWLHWGRFTHGWALAELGQLEQGTTEMEAAIAGFEHMGGVPFQPYGIALLARSYARKGRTSQAFTMVGEALARINRTGEKVDQAEIPRLKGEVMLSNAR